MAFLPDDTKTKSDDPNQSTIQQSPGDASGIVATGGQASSSGAGSGSPGIGAGGQGAWTNIQAYLNANQGDTGSADKLTKNANDVYSKENKNLTDQSNQAKSAAKTSVDSTMGQDQASKLIEDAGQNYSYGGTQNDQYNKDVSGVKGALSAKYNGPSEFNYGISSDAQRYGQAGTDDTAFHGLMGDLYNQSAGGQMTQGQMDLQNQLDVNNPALYQARQNMLQQYSGLQGNVQNTVNDTTNALHGYSDQFNQNQQDLNRYLYDQAASERTTADSALQSARSAYDNDFNNSLSQAKNVDFAGAPGYNGGNYLTPAQEKGVIDYLNQRNPELGIPSIDQMGGSAGEDARNIQGSLNDWYAQQEQKYAGAGDADKKKWNSIADILGLTTPAYAQGNDIVRR